MQIIDTLFDEIPNEYSYFCCEEWQTVGCAYKADELQELAEELHAYWSEWDADAWTVTTIMTAVLRIPAGEEISFGDIRIRKLSPVYGIFVNEDGCVPYANAIVYGHKTIETRNKNMLSAPSEKS